MSWITILWAMNAGACLTLAAIYCVVWSKQCENWLYLLFSSSAIAAAGVAGFELAMLHADTVGQYEALMRGIHVPVWVLTLSFVAFVRRYFHAGRAWLAWSIYGLRTLVLILNFILTPNVNFLAITRVRHLSCWGGEIVSLPVGPPNPWNLLSLASLVLLFIFSVDATISLWRRNSRRRALVIGGSMIFGTILAVHVPLVIWGIINAPFFLCFAYSGIVLAMGYELSNDMLRTTQLAKQLESSEADLRETQERMELAASAAELGMWTWDIVRNEIWITDKGRALFGFAASERLDFDRFRSRLHPEDRESVLATVENSLRSGAEYRSEYRIVLPDGQLRWIAGRGHVEFNTEGKPVRMRGASLDITKRKQAEEQAVRQRDEMAHLSRVTMLGELSSSIAHELNLPLSAILSNAQAAQRILANGADLTEVRDILDDIVSEDKHASEVIHRLRQWLKKGELRQDSVDINRVVEDVLKLIRSDLINQKVAVNTDLGRNLPTIIGDAVQLQQVLLNLVVNACDAMTSCNSSKRQLLIRTGIGGNGSNAVVVSVTDKGCSIPEEKMERIFEPFFTTKQKGMGLGLSVCLSIITAHRGKLWATNNADCGVTFHFSLPVEVSPVAAALCRRGVGSVTIKAPRNSSRQVNSEVAATFIQ